MRVAEPSASWNNLNVAVVRDAEVTQYPARDQVPFDPAAAYPEYDGPVSPHPNRTYDLVRIALRRLEQDEANFNTPAWNPLGSVVQPGMKIVVKPNLVADTVRPGTDLIALFTHMSVIRAVIDYVQIALKGDGAIVVGDAPIQRTNWDNLMRISGIGESIELLNRRGRVPIKLVDFRREVTVRDSMGVAVSREVRSGADFVEVDLGRNSTLMPLIDDYRKFRVSQYDPAALQRHHNHERNCYMIHRSVLDADVVIGIPKLKVHKKAGITGALKNTVGIVCGKDWLPHFRTGDAETGAGDQYAHKSRLQEAQTILCDAMETGHSGKRRAAAVLAKGVRGLMRLGGISLLTEGNWHGNDTTWRMVHDLNLALCYAGHDGMMNSEVRRSTLYVVDGIIGGERDSPLHPTAHPAGTIIAGTNPIAVDAVGATVIGLDIAKTPLLRSAWQAPSALQLPPSGATLDDVHVHADLDGDCRRVDLAALKQRINLHFEPPSGWVGTIEREPVDAT